MATKKRDSATRTEIIQINKLMEEKLVKTTGSDNWEYVEDWTDEKIAETIGCSLSSVRTLRLELFGKLRTRASTITLEKIEDIEKTNKELVLKFNRLIDNLRLNNVIDVRHLKIDGGAEKEGK